MGRLRSLVASRKIVCVSHLTSILEIAKQLEGSARISTALVDELTERVTNRLHLDIKYQCRVVGQGIKAALAALNEFEQ